ncbi:MAG: electron transfer flavoprotein subunit beta [Myxococcales bacterium]
MKILVTAKRVTDPDAKIKLKPDMTGIQTDGVEYKVNPFCENAIEEALRLGDKTGAEVVVVSIGPEDAKQYIRTGLAMGAARGILVSGIEDDKLDSDLTARILAKVYEREQPDLFIFGKQAIDGDSNQVAQLVAAYTGLPQACFASKVELTGGTARVTREVDGGLETIEVSLPAVISADLRLNEPRYASLPGIMKAKRKPIDEIEVSSLGVDTTLKVRTIRYENPPSRGGGVKMVESVDELLGKLKNEAKAL